VDFIPPGPTITRLKETIEDPDVTYLIGYAGSQLPDAIRRGAQGLMSGCGHIAEDIAMFESVIRSRGIPSATFQRLLPLLNFETQTIDLSIATHKRLLFEQGIIAQPHLRSPSLVMDEFQECELIELWNAAKTPGTSMPIASNVEARGIDP
jgi:4-hydroxy-tetrahydrodipicolinate synthase